MKSLRLSQRYKYNLKTEFLPKRQVVINSEGLHRYVTSGGVGGRRGPNISQILLCMLQFLDNLWWRLIFSIDEIITLLKSTKLNARPSEKFIIVNDPKETHNEREFKR